MLNYSLLAWDEGVAKSWFLLFLCAILEPNDDGCLLMGFLPLHAIAFKLVNLTNHP